MFLAKLAYSKKKKMLIYLKYIGLETVIGKQLPRITNRDKV